jgi:hypothetical protein
MDCPPPARTPGAAAGRGLLTLVVIAVLWCAATPAHADVDLGFSKLGEYENEIVRQVTAVATGQQLNRVCTTLFTVMALGLFMFKCAGWALRGFQLAEMVETAMQIMLTGFMMASFTIVVPAIFEASLFVGQAMLTGIAGVSPASTENASLPVAVVNMLVKYGESIGPDCEASLTNPLGCLSGGGPVMVVTSVVMSVVLVLLCIAILLVDLWGFWIYAIALAIGPVLVPFTLYPRLAFLFDGWLRFFFGVVVYVILARVNLGVVFVAILSSMSTTAEAVASSGFTLPMQPRIKDLADILGRMLFCSVGIFSLLATGRFASAIVAGAAGGGLTFGKAAQAIKKVANSVSQTSSSRNARSQPQRGRQAASTRPQTSAGGAAASGPGRGGSRSASRRTSGSGRQGTSRASP